MQRLCIAAAVSVAMHLSLALSVGRGGAGDNPFAERGAAPALIARLQQAAPADAPALPETTGGLAAQPVAEPPASAPATPVAQQISGVSNPGEIYYFKASELDRRPFPLERIEIPPPDSAAAASGSVMLRLRISESGQVDEASIVMGTGIAEFEAAALDTFAQARFHPGYRANLPVRSEMLIEVTLQPPPASPGSAR